jgi:hypothetical protein
MKERPILFSIVTGQPSQRGKRLRSKDGMTWRQRNKENVNRRKRELYAKNVGTERMRASIYRKKKASSVNAYNRKWLLKYRATVRAEMLAAYGRACSCCGEREPMFLELDHIHNDGAAERRRHGNQFVEWVYLRKQGWPKGNHQLLCANCNKGKAKNGGTCPHKKSR